MNVERHLYLAFFCLGLLLAGAGCGLLYVTVGSWWNWLPGTVLLLIGAILAVAGFLVRVFYSGSRTEREFPWPAGSAPGNDQFSSRT
jgi:hypothetical protein